ncbi:MAG: DinB family protein [Bacteroidia bacterium]|nr:DinB family protein [Bacteroidia bacterium]
MLTLLYRLYHYHAWRVGEVLGHLETLPPEVWQRPIAGSFGTLHRLVWHTALAEQLWQQRLQGARSTPWPDYDPELPLEALFDTWQHLADRWPAFIGQDEAALATELHYATLDGKPSTSIRADALLHVADHCTYHIGQMVTALRELGQTPFSVSFIRYTRA